MHEDDVAVIANEGEQVVIRRRHKALQALLLAAWKHEMPIRQMQSTTGTNDSPNQTYHRIKNASMDWVTQMLLHQ